jgi:hypothetical protein
VSRPDTTGHAWPHGTQRPDRSAEAFRKEFVAPPRTTAPELMSMPPGRLDGRPIGDIGLAGVGRTAVIT